MYTKFCAHCINPFETGSKKTRFCSLKCAGFARGASPEQIRAGYWARVDKTGDCWLWTGCVTTFGYGFYRWKKPNKMVHTHRIAWELEHGPIPEGMHVLHKCDVRPCCNPAHLWLGTHQENMADMRAKGRAWKGGNKKRAAISQSTTPL